MSQVTLSKSDGPATSAGTSLASETPTETSTWTEVPNISAAIPAGGALLRVVANSAAMRVAIITNGRDLPTVPPHNGHALALGATRTELVDPGTRVFTRTL
jgi:hypothetical protein